MDMQAVSPRTASPVLRTRTVCRCAAAGHSHAGCSYNVGRPAAAKRPFVVAKDASQQLGDVPDDPATQLDQLIASVPHKDVREVMRRNRKVLLALGYTTDASFHGTTKKELIELGILPGLAAVIKWAFPDPGAHQPVTSVPTTTTASVPLIKPHGELLRYLTGLSEDEQVAVFSILAAGGYAEPGCENEVESLTNEELEELGIKPLGLRLRLLRAFSTAGPSKAVFLVYSNGVKEEVEFKHKRHFEAWLATNTVTLPHKMTINTWEQLQDGVTYCNTRKGRYGW